METLHFEYRNGLRPQESIRDFVLRKHDELIAEAQRWEPDVVLVLKGELITPPTLVQLSKMGVRTAVWNFDVWAQLDPKQPWIWEQARAADHFFTIGKGMVPRFKEQGVRAHWLLEAADPEAHFRPMAEEWERKWPISFIGTIEDVGCEERVSWLQRIYSANQEGLHLWGSFPGPFKEFPNYHGRALGDEGFREVVWGSRVNLGRDRNPEIERSYGARLFRTLACGGYLITSATKGIENDFNDCVDTYESDVECVEKVRAALYDHPAGCAKMAERGQRLVYEKHLFKHRAAEILKVASRCS